MKKKLVLFALLILNVSFVYSQSAEEVVSRYLSKIGGVDKLKVVKSRKAVAILAMQGAELSATLYEKPVAMKRIEFSVPGIEIIQTYNGKEGWMLNPQMGKDPVMLSEEQLKDIAEDEFEDKFIDYKKKGHEITLLGTEEIEGIKCFKVQMIKNKNNDREDVKELHYFDTETYFPVLEIGFKNRDQRIIELREYSSDYHEVGGLMFPFYKEIKVDGQTIQKLTIEKIILDESLDDSLFTLIKK